MGAIWSQTGINSSEKIPQSSAQIQSFQIQTQVETQIQMQIWSQASIKHSSEQRSNTIFANTNTSTSTTLDLYGDHLRKASNEKRLRLCPNQQTLPTNPPLQFMSPKSEENVHEKNMFRIIKYAI